METPKLNGPGAAFAADKKKQKRRGEEMRSTGVLLPIASLPTKYGIGGFSKEAYDFVDWLKAAGVDYWQILPLGPTGYGDSPYQSISTFAGNPYFIDLEALIEEKLLTPEECKEADCGKNPKYVDYGEMYNTRLKLLKKAFKRSKHSHQASMNSSHRTPGTF